MTLDGYHWTWKSDTDTDYETLFRPDGSEVTTITEPEDRVSYRDLEPITAELNRLIARLRAAEAVVDPARVWANWLHPQNLVDAIAAYDALGGSK